MITFLQSIAKAYASRYADMSDFCFLFPNKRSGTFFLKYLKEECHRHTMLAPDVKSITDFVGFLSGRTVAPRIDLLFHLYHSYRKLLGLPEEDEGENEGVSFDSFCGWGETVLSDFNEVDLYLANPDEVFKNVKDYREISSNFLTEEQKRVMWEYFGRTDNADPSVFWKNFDNEDNLSDAKKRFLHLWRLMSPLYDELGERLEGAGLTTTGGAYRLALKKLQDNDPAKILPYKKVIAVGFNALSTSEQSIFRALQETEGEIDAFADFFWDATGPILSGEVNSASKFVRANIRNFPSPEWAIPSLQMSDCREMPAELRVAASPSNSAQVKIAGTLLKELRGRLTGDEFTQAKVAVVLPDENLLLPMLYSLPAGMGDVNLTMGYPLRLTSVVPFVTLLRRLLSNCRRADGSVQFYHRDLRVFLAHPFSHACFTSQAVNNIISYIDSHHKASVSIDELQELSPEAAEVLSGLPSEATPRETISYLSGVLERVAARLPSMEDAMVKSRLEISHIEVYRDSLRRLADILSGYGVKMKPRTVFRMADRLLAGETVGFEGEPLTGLQVMGMLETRSIDFEHVLILSANERVLPRRARTRSFIPDTLRHAYGMPPANYAEGIFAYYFYRMISRAKSVSMIYDARSGAGLSSGDVSRYILQLRHLFAKDAMQEEDWKFILSGKVPHDPSVEKNAEVMERLHRYLEPEGKNLSVSALKSYRECEVKFFYQNVMGLDTDPEPSEFIDAIGAGNILHAILMELYLPKQLQRAVLDPPVLMTAERLEQLLGDRQGLWRTVTRTVNRLHFRLDGESLDTPLSGGAQMVARQIERQVRMVMEHDLRQAPFRLYGCEIEDLMHVALPTGERVNFKFAIDRLDETLRDGEPQLRIIDYKTGMVKLEAEEFGEIFHGDYRSEQIFQLFTYAWLLGKYAGIKGEINGRESDVCMEIYEVPKIHLGDRQLPVIGEETVATYAPYSDAFSEGMESMLSDIFHKPRFEAVENELECTRCPFRRLCRR